MLALWMRFRTAAVQATDAGWVPKGIKVPLVPANTMLLAFLPICVFAQWSVYSARRNFRSQTAMALVLVALLGLAVVNAQAFVYARMKLPITGKTATTAYNSMFYAITGTYLVLVVLGIGFSAITAFRYLGGRTADREIVSAHALYWYFLGALYFALWYVVYVTK